MIHRFRLQSPGRMVRDMTGEYMLAADHGREMDALSLRCASLEACIRNGMKVYTGNGHPDRALAELWDQEARQVLSGAPGVDGKHE